MQGTQTLRVSFDAQEVLDRMMPSMQWAMESGCLSIEDAREILLDELLGTMKTEVIDGQA